jgi:hypothetical protein
MYHHLLTSHPYRIFESEQRVHAYGGGREDKARGDSRERLVTARLE